MLKELSQRFCTVKNLKIDNFIQKNKGQLVKGKKSKKSYNRISLNRLNIRNRSLTPNSNLNYDLILTPITKDKGEGKLRNTDTYLNKKKNSYTMKSVNITRSKKFESPLSSKEEIKEVKNNSFKNKCTKPHVDENNFEYLNTEESLNQYKDQRFSFKVKKENNNQIIKEEISEINNLQGIVCAKIKRLKINQLIIRKIYSKEKVP
jgi:hypothetical protein